MSEQTEWEKYQEWLKSQGWEDKHSFDSYMAQRDAATVEECAKACDPPRGSSIRAPYEQCAAKIRSLRPDADRTLARIRLEARIEEAEWWYEKSVLEQDADNPYPQQKRIASLKDELANAEKENS